MNKNQNMKLVGKVKEAHGLQGELFVIIFSKQSEWISKLSSFALAKDESSEKTNFKLKKCRRIKDGLILKVAGLDNRNQSEALVGQLFFIPEELLLSQAGEMIYLKEIQDFDVFDQQISIGKIVGFSSNGPQDLLVVNSKQGLVEIPFVEDFIQEIDFTKRQVSMKLPEGLLELNLKGEG